MKLKDSMEDNSNWDTKWYTAILRRKTVEVLEASAAHQGHLGPSHTEGLALWAAWQTTKRKMKFWQIVCHHRTMVSHKFQLWLTFSCVPPTLSLEQLACWSDYQKRQQEGTVTKFHNHYLHYLAFLWWECADPQGRASHAQMLSKITI